MRQQAIDAIIQECRDQGITKPEQIQYVLATVEHETAGTFRPVKEAFWLSDAKRRAYLRSKPYAPYWGRGYVQLTWRENYVKAQKVLRDVFGLDVDLVRDPDKALEDDVARKILVYGMKSGFFTGRKLDDYFSDIAGSNFYKARRIINGLDKAAHIARLAQNYKLA